MRMDQKQAGFAAALRQALAAAALGAAFLAISGCSGLTPAAAPHGTLPASIASAGARPATTSSWTFQTLDDPNSGSSYNVLTGINNQQHISGYYGQGGSSDPSHGFIVYPPWGTNNFTNENYPGADGTQVLALNNTKWICGTYTSGAWTYGFTLVAGVWVSYKDPKLRHDNGHVTALLGISDSDLSVGYYTGQSGENNGFELDIPIAKYHGVAPPNGSNGVATGINGKGDIVGYVTLGNGTTEAYLLKGAQYTEYAFPGAVSTQAYSINWQDQIAGSYVDASGATHGFILTNPLGSEQWQQVDEPDAVGSTVITGMNNHHYLVGYYVDGTGTHGFAATPKAAR